MIGFHRFVFGAGRSGVLRGAGTTDSNTARISRRWNRNWCANARIYVTPDAVSRPSNSQGMPSSFCGGFTDICWRRCASSTGGWHDPGEWLCVLVVVVCLVFLSGWRWRWSPVC